MYTEEKRVLYRGRRVCGHSKETVCTEERKCMYVRGSRCVGKRECVYREISFWKKETLNVERKGVSSQAAECMYKGR